MNEKDFKNNFIGYQDFIQNLINDITNFKKEISKNIFIVLGKTGAGKTEVSRYILNTLGYSIKPLNCEDEINVSIIQKYFKEMENKYDIVYSVQSQKVRFAGIIDNVDLLEKTYLAELYKNLKRKDLIGIPFIIIGTPIIEKKFAKVSTQSYLLPDLTKKNIKEIINKKSVSKLKVKDVKELTEKFTGDISELINSIKTKQQKDKYIELNFYDITKKIMFDKLTFKDLNIIALNELSVIPNMIHQNLPYIIKKKFSPKIQLNKLLECYSTIIDSVSIPEDFYYLHLISNINSILNDNVKSLKENSKDMDFTNIYTKLSIESGISKVLESMSRKIGLNINNFVIVRRIIFNDIQNEDFNFIKYLDITDNINDLMCLNKNQEEDIRKIYVNKNFKKKLQKLKEDNSFYMSSGDTNNSSSSDNMEISDE